MNAATVYLVGAGPGDVGLATIRCLELLRQADAVVYDYLASPELLDEVPEAAQRIYVGKKGFSEHIGQDEINNLLVQTARDVAAQGGTRIVRLKGGDPYLFGRGGEEALALARAGVPFEVVPGVTSGIAAPAYAGMPVTHRGIASTVTFVTGHEDPTKNESHIDWTALASLAQAGGTLCFYMGMRNLALISERLRGAGVPEAFPVALVQWGTTARQRTLVSTLAEVDAAAREAGFGAPAIIMVGETASLHEELAFFEKRELLGKRLVVTRSRTQASSLVGRLAELGADVIELPTIAICEPDDYEALDAALAHLADYDWIVFTSVNGVDAFFARLDGDARALAGSRVAAIGPATAERLKGYGIVADALPSEYRGEAVFEAMASVCALDGARVLIARAQEAREALPHMLQEAGAQVDVAAAYKTVVPANVDAADLAARLRSGEIDGVTFTSSSTARNLVALLGDDASALRDTTLYSIGPITTSTLREMGFERIVEACEYTIPGLISAILEDTH